MSLPAPTGSPYRIGIVCLGNICRSPTADVVLRKLLADAGLTDRVEVTSSGTGDWHVGGPMDTRAAAQLTAAGYDASAHRAQQFGPAWLDRDLLLAMDAKNLADIGGGNDRVRMFRSFDPEVPADATTTELDTPDPYGGGEDGFVAVLEIVERTCRQLGRELEELLGRPDR
jgi:protein-tyrosine phosphatase